MTYDNDQVVFFVIKIHRLLDEVITRGFVTFARSIIAAAYAYAIFDFAFRYVMSCAFFQKLVVSLHSPSMFRNEKLRHVPVSHKIVLN